MHTTKLSDSPRWFLLERALELAIVERRIQQTNVLSNSLNHALKPSSGIRSEWQHVYHESTRSTSEGLKGGLEDNMPE